MEHLCTVLKPYYTRFKGMVHTTPYDIIHLPSFLLGCFLTLNLILLEPVFRTLVGGVLISAITLIKYCAIIGGVILCSAVLASKDGKVTLKKKDEHINPKLNARQQFISQVDNDFEIVGYNDLTDVRSKEVQKEANVEEFVYEDFIQRANRK